MSPADQIVVNSVRQWFEKAVLGLNLCPFAAHPYRQGAIQFELSHAKNDVDSLTDLYLNLNRLDQQPQIETLVLICADHLIKFSDYNQFLALAEALVEQEGWSGIYQVASFHPDYQFSGSDKHDRANWTNRSPYPLLHLIREDSISLAVESHADINEIPKTNIKTLDGLSDAQMRDVFGQRYRALSKPG